MAPVPRAHGCEPNAISARPPPSSLSSTVPAYRPPASTAKPQRPSAQPPGMTSRTKRSASASPYGVGTVVQRTLPGSWLCSTTPDHVVVPVGADRDRAVGEGRGSGHAGTLPSRPPTGNPIGA